MPILTFLGHAAFKLECRQGSYSLLIDPFLTGQGKSPAEVAELTKNTSHILLTHGHADHVGDTAAIAKTNHDIPVFGMLELMQWLEKTAAVKNTIGSNFGGPVKLHDRVTATLVPAWHTSTAPDGTYLGEAAGLIIEIAPVPASDQRSALRVLHMGDTTIFSDMALINELYQPEVVIVPVGGHFTMDARVAAIACQRYFPTAKLFVPCHYGTFPILAPNPDDFIALMPDLPVKPLSFGESIEL